MARLPEPPRTGNAAWDAYAAQLKRITETEFNRLGRQHLIPVFVRTELPAADLPPKWIYVPNALRVVGTATTTVACPAYNDGTAWRRSDDGNTV